MAASGSTLRVKGLSGLIKAFAVADLELKKELRGTLREVAEPVRVDAEVLAVGRISHVGVPWSRMRVGVTARSVYVAPKQRGARGRSNRRRPNLADLLMDRSMQPALDANVQGVEHGVERLLDRVGRDWKRA